MISTGPRHAGVRGANPGACWMAWVRPPSFAWRVLCIGALLALAASPPLQASAFGSGGAAIPDIRIRGGFGTPQAVIQQPDGSVIVSGTAAGPVADTMFAARYTAAGVLDSSYATGGIAYIAVPSGIGRIDLGGAAIDGSGRLVLAGHSSATLYEFMPQVTVVRLLPNGTPDPSFGTAGLVRHRLDDYNLGAHATAVAIDSQQRIVIGGGVHDSSAGRGGLLAMRLTDTGALDTTFNAIGYRVLNLSAYTWDATSLAVGAGDTVTLAGNDDPFSTTPFAIARLTPTGALDPSFGGTGVVHVAGGGPVGVDGAGNVLVASPGPYPQQDTMFVTRLTAAGNVDALFGTGGTAQYSTGGYLINPSLYGLRVDHAGRIVLAVSGYTPSGRGYAAVRLASGGNPDTTFNGSGIRVVGAGLSVDVTRVALEIGSTDDVWLAMGLTQFALAHITASGAMDSGFNATGLLIDTAGVQPVTLTGMARQPDGKFLLSGYAGSNYAAFGASLVVARLTTAGALDPTFNGTGYRVIDTTDGGWSFTAVALDTTGRIVLARRTAAEAFYVVRLLTTGALDASFGTGGAAVVTDTPKNLEGHGLAVDSHDRILLVGGSLSRLTSSGTPDAAFGTNGRATVSLSVPMSGAIPIVVDPSDRALVGGYVASDTARSFAIARYTASGTPDVGFGNGGIATFAFGQSWWNLEVHALAFDSSGALFFSGPWQSCSSPVGVGKLTTAGTLDPSFHSGSLVCVDSPSWPFPNAMAIDPSGRIVLTGDGFTTRLDANGNVDATFNGGLPAVTHLVPASLRIHTTAVRADADGVYVGGTAGYAMAVVKLFDGVPVQLALSVRYPGVRAGIPFDIVVQAQDADGSPQPVGAPTTVVLTQRSGTLSLSGPTTCVIATGQTTCTLYGLVYQTSDPALALDVAATSGDPLAGGTITLSITEQRARTTVLGQSTSVLAGLNGAVAVSINVDAFSFVTPFTGEPGGHVQFFIDGVLYTTTGLTDIVPASCGPTLCYVAEAHFSASALPVGTHTFTASYSGDVFYQPGTSAPFTITVSPITRRVATITAGVPDTFIDSRPVTLAAAITIDQADRPLLLPGEPGGHIMFVETTGNVWTTQGITDVVPDSCGATRCYVAEGHVSPLGMPVGTHTFTAYYSGDPLFMGSTSAPFTVTITPVARRAPTQISGVPTTATDSDAITIAAGITIDAADASTLLPGEPGGTVQFYDNGVRFAGEGLTDIVPAQCGASRCYVAESHFSVFALSAGNHVFTASYSGDAFFLPSTSAPFTVTIAPTVTTSTQTVGVPATGAVAQPVTVAAALTISASDAAAITPGQPGGTMQFLDNGVPLYSWGITDVVPAQCGATRCYVAEAHFTTATLAVGTHHFTAVYSGTPKFASSTSAPFDIIIAPATAKELKAAATVAVPTLDRVWLGGLAALMLVIGAMTLHARRMSRRG